MREPLLPDAFGELVPFADWALEPERARSEKKAAASIGEVRAFYDAMMPRIDEVLAYLEEHLAHDMPAEAHRLYLVSSSLVEVATLVELYKRRESVHACGPLRFVPQL